MIAALRPEQSTEDAALRVDTPVVVLNTFHTGLAIARDLGRLGVRVIGLSDRPRAYGNVSRFIEYRHAPDSLARPAELLVFLQGLREELKQSPVLLPTRDHDINFIVDNWDALHGKFMLPMLPPVRMREVLNKDVVAVAARASGIGVPNSVTIARSEDIHQARSLTYPCVCKPVYASQWRKPGIWDAVGRQKVRRVESFSELADFYRSFAHLDPVVTVQEWIEGGETSLQIFGSYCSADHEVIAFFTARKRLQTPRLAGTGVAVEALPIPDLEEPSRQLLRRLGFYGISEIEFKRDERDGRLNLIEINARHWDQHGLGTMVGVNLSETLYRDATSQRSRPMHQGAGRKVWIGDLELLRYVVNVLKGRAPVRDLAILLALNKAPSVFAWSDPRPFFALMSVLFASRR